MGHGGAPLLPFVKILFTLINLGTLEVADVDGDLFDRRSQQRQRAHQSGVAIALHHLIAHGCGFEPQLFADVLFQFHRRMGEIPHRTAYFADIDDIVRLFEVLQMTLHLVIPDRQDKTEGDGFTVDAVAASYHQRQFMLHRTPLDRLHYRFHVFDDQFQTVAHLQGYGGVDRIGARHPVVHPATLLTEALGDTGQKGDDVMACLSLDLVDTIDIERGVLFDLFRIFVGNQPQSVPRFDRRDLHIEPCLILRLHCPFGFHLFTGISLYHRLPFRGNIFLSSS